MDAGNPNNQAAHLNNMSLANNIRDLSSLSRAKKRRLVKNNLIINKKIIKKEYFFSKIP